jgi:serine/threonine-protein kinase
MFETLGHYKILERIGAGDMGEVFRARDTHHGRTVAVQVIVSDVAADPVQRARLIADARIAAALSHPNIALLYESGEDQDQLFLVYEYVPGKTLKRMRNIAENPMVALVVDVYDEDWRRLEYALVHGRAEVVEDPGDRHRSLEALRDRYQQYRSMALDAPHNQVVRITPARVHHWRFTG